MYISGYRVGSETAKYEQWIRKESKCTGYYDYDQYQVVQIYCYQFVIFLTI